MAYIRLDKDLVNDPRLFALAEQLGNSLRFSSAAGEFSSHANRNALRNALLGALVTLWCYADTHIRSDDTLPISLSSLSDVIGLPVEFLQHLPPDWLTIRPDGTVKLPGYIEKNGIISKNRRREQTRARVARWRQKNDRRGNADCNALHSATTGTGTDPLPKPKKELKPPTPFPTNLEVETWERWFRYRSEIRKPIKAASMEAAMHKLAEFGKDQGAVVEQSIANGWQGLFPLKNNAGSSQPKLGKLARAAEALRKFNESYEQPAINGTARTVANDDETA